MAYYSKMNASVTAKVFRVKILLVFTNMICDRFFLYDSYFGGCPLSRESMEMDNVQNNICIMCHHLSHTWQRSVRVSPDAVES
jgi:hypothetical protein